LDHSTYYNPLCLASKEVYQASHHLIPPWPQGHCFQVRKWVTAVCFLPYGQTLAVSSNHKKVYLWNVQKGLYTKLQGHDNPVTLLVYSPDGKLSKVAGGVAFFGRIYYLQVRICIFVPGIFLFSHLALSQIKIKTTEPFKETQDQHQYAQTHHVPPAPTSVF
jgi:hypothetical protein